MMEKYKNIRIKSLMDNKLTMKQAKIIFGKIGMLKNDYPNVAREIEIYRDTQNDILCYLHNGSKIKVVACGESGRRRTCNFYYFRRV